MTKSCLNAKTMLINLINLPCNKTLHSRPYTLNDSFSSSSRFFIAFGVQSIVQLINATILVNQTENSGLHCAHGCVP